MKYLNFICYSLLLMLLFNTSSLYAAPPLQTSYILHTPLVSLMLEPLRVLTTRLSLPQPGGS